MSNMMIAKWTNLVAQISV